MSTFIDCGERISKRWGRVKPKKGEHLGEITFKLNFLHKLLGLKSSMHIASVWIEPKDLSLHIVIAHVPKRR